MIYVICICCFNQRINLLETGIRIGKYVTHNFNCQGNFNLVYIYFLESYYYDYYTFIDQKILINAT